MSGATITPDEAHDWSCGSIADAAWWLCPICEDEIYVPDHCEAPRCDTCAEPMERSK